MRNPKFYVALLFLLAGCLMADPSVAIATSADEEVQQLNETLTTEGLPWQAGRTSVMELSPAERRALLGGPSEPFSMDPPTLDVADEGGTAPEPYSGGAPPVASFDWRNRGGINWMTPVTDQCCGDCWAHATMGSMEVRLRWQKGGTYGYQLPINLAERYCVNAYHSGNCSGWNIPGLLSNIQSDGVTDEDCMPYNCTSSLADRCANWNVRLYKVAGYGTYYGPGATFEDDVATSCYYNGPIPVWMMVYSDFYGYSSGIYVKSATATEEGGHFVNIVGWGTSGGVDYWICKNSWGTGWGYSGYFYIRRGTNESRMEEQAYWLTPQNLPNLDDSTPTGWDYPIVPRGDATATSASAHVSATLPGNSNSTYWNVNWINEGTVQARDNVTHLSVDDIYTYWLSISFQPSGYESKHVNYGTSTVKGGRHTICQNTMDWDDRVWEYDEGDNTYCRQFVWSPYALSNNYPVERTTPPKKDSLGYNWYNNDGFSFLVQNNHPDDWWSAVGILPSNTGADYDLRLWDIGDYTGSQVGFGGSYLEYSSYGGSASDFVIVNNNLDSTGTYYAGVLNDNQGTGNFQIEEDTSQKIYTGTNGPYSKSSTNVLDIYEYYIYPAGNYGFKLEQTSGSCDLGMSLYDDETVTVQKNEYMTGGYANSGGDGANEFMQVTIPDDGFHGLVVWKVDSSDYGKVAGYRIKVGQCATPSAPVNPSPANGATNVSVNADLNWNDCTNTEYYDVWLKEGSGNWVKLGETENSSWTLPTLSAGTTYEWFINANNICGGYSNVYWSFTTESDDPPVIDDIDYDACISECPTCPDADIVVTAHDPAGGSLSYAWTALDGGSVIGGGSSVDFDPPNSGPHPCPYRVRVQVTSSVSGLTTTQIVPITVKLKGDVDANGVVNILDKVAVRNAFGTSGAPGWIPADVDYNGVVNILDKVAVRNQFGQSGCACP